MEKMICIVALFANLVFTGCETRERKHIPNIRAAEENDTTTGKRQQLIAAYETKRDHTETRIDTIIQRVQAMPPKAREKYYKTLDALKKDQRNLEDRIAVFRSVSDTGTERDARNGIDSVIVNLERSLEEVEAILKDK